MGLWPFWQPALIGLLYYIIFICYFTYKYLWEIIKDACLLLRMELRLISLSQAIEPVGGYTTESVTHGQPQSITAQWPVPIYTAR